MTCFNPFYAMKVRQKQVTALLESFQPQPQPRVNLPPNVTSFHTLWLKKKEKKNGNRTVLVSCCPSTSNLPQCYHCSKDNNIHVE